MPYITSHLPLFDECFGSGISSQNAFQKLKNNPPNGRPDFVIQTLLPQQSPVLGWLGRVMMIPLYPAQSSFAKRCFSKLHPNHLDKIRAKDQSEIERQGTQYAREVTLEKNGVRYSGLMMGNKACLTNGKWILQAMGRDCPFERSARKCRTLYGQAGFNVLMVNGPSIGRSQGFATPHSLGEAQEAGLCFLETALRAKQIAIAGHSMGGGVIGQAVLQHEFQKDIKYLVIQQTTFDRIGNAVHHFLPCFKNSARTAIRKHGLEIDTVEASKKLEKLGIPEIIIQPSNRHLEPREIPKAEDFSFDGVLSPQATLGYSLIKEKVLRHKRFRCLPGLSHFDSDRYIKATQKELETFASPPSLFRSLWVTLPSIP